VVCTVRNSHVMRMIGRLSTRKHEKTRLSRGTLCQTRRTGSQVPFPVNGKGKAQQSRHAQLTWFRGEFPGPLAQQMSDKWDGLDGAASCPPLWTGETPASLEDCPTNLRASCACLLFCEGGFQTRAVQRLATRLRLFLPFPGSAWECVGWRLCLHLM
jgi:hypothetical protein